MGDHKKTSSILCAQAEFPLDLIRAFKKPLRTGLQPLGLGAVVQFESIDPTEPVRYGLLLRADRAEQEIEVAPITVCEGICSSTLRDYDCFIMGKEDYTKMGFERPMVINIADVRTIQLKKNQIQSATTYMYLTHDERCPILRSTGTASDDILQEALSGLTSFRKDQWEKEFRSHRMARGVGNSRLHTWADYLRDLINDRGDDDNAPAFRR